MSWSDSADVRRWRSRAPLTVRYTWTAGRLARPAIRRLFRERQHLWLALLAVLAPFLVLFPGMLFALLDHRTGTAEAAAWVTVLVAFSLALGAFLGAPFAPARHAPFFTLVGLRRRHGLVAALAWAGLLSLPFWLAWLLPAGLHDPPAGTGSNRSRYGWVLAACAVAFCAGVMPRSRALPIRWPAVRVFPVAPMAMAVHAASLAAVVVIDAFEDESFGKYVAVGATWMIGNLALSRWMREAQRFCDGHVQFLTAAFGAGSASRAMARRSAQLLIGFHAAAAGLALAASASLPGGLYLSLVLLASQPLLAALAFAARRWRSGEVVLLAVCLGVMRLAP